MVEWPDHRSDCCVAFIFQNNASTESTQSEYYFMSRLSFFLHAFSLHAQANCLVATLIIIKSSTIFLDEKSSCCAVNVIADQFLILFTYETDHSERLLPDQQNKNVFWMVLQFHRTNEYANTFFAGTSMHYRPYRQNKKKNTKKPDFLRWPVFSHTLSVDRQLFVYALSRPYQIATLNFCE